MVESQTKQTMNDATSNKTTKEQEAKEVRAEAHKVPPEK
jgi:hypothetical protein